MITDYKIAENLQLRGLYFKFETVIGIATQLLTIKSVSS
jgi:hypothetical protein